MAIEAIHGEKLREDADRRKNFQALKDAFEEAVRDVNNQGSGDGLHAFLIALEKRYNLKKH